MAYNRENILQRIIDIQNITLEYTSKGVTQEYVFTTYIKPLYRISRSTYYAYLSTPAKLELKGIVKNKKRQLQLF